MATFYSDHFTATDSGTSIDAPRFKIDPGICHAKVYYKRASVIAPAAITTADILVIMQLKTSDRLHHLYLSTPAFTGGGQPADCGLYDEDGTTVIDVDLFGSEVSGTTDDLSVLVPRDDVLTQGALEDEDRGKMLFQMADEGLASTLYDNDPHEIWTVCLTMGTENAITAGAEIVMEAFYTSAGS